MLGTDADCSAWHEAERLGVQVIEGSDGHLFINGPLGSEGTARALRDAPAGVVHELIAHGCGCVQVLELFEPARFSRREHAKLRELQQRLAPQQALRNIPWDVSFACSPFGMAQ